MCRAVAVLLFATLCAAVTPGTGSKENPPDKNISESTGFKQVEPTTSFESRLAAAFHERWGVYAVTNQPVSKRLERQP